LHLLPNKLQLSSTIELQYSKIDSVSIKRNVNNIVIINVSAEEETRVTFADNMDRDVFCLVLRKHIEEFAKDPTRISEKEYFLKKE
jgi:hypothetical protein